MELTNDESRIVVGIITRDRPDELQACLAALEGELTSDARVVIVDNGDAPCGVTSGGRITVLTSVPGYCTARNAVLQAADGAEWLIFVDDDQCVRPGWLQRMVAAAQAHPGSVIAGRRIMVLPDSVTDPALRDAVERLNAPRPQGWAEEAGTGNSLVPLAGWIRAGRPLFREEFAAIGGEDTDFFGRLGEAGIRVWIEPSVEVDEPIIPSRLNRVWLVRRVYNSGQARGLITMLEGGRLARVKVLFGGLARIGAGLVEGARTSVRTRHVWPQYYYRAIVGAGFVRQAVTGGPGR